MINKMTKKLKELHSNLGCPETILTSVAKVAITGLADDADDAAITARANDESIVDMLKAFQSHVDTVRTAAKKGKRIGAMIPRRGAYSKNRYEYPL